MPQPTNCAKAHPERGSGPCVSCGSNSQTNRYIHLIQRRDTNSDFYNYVKNYFPYGDTDCICRKCDVKLNRKMSKPQDADITNSAKKECLENKLDNTDIEADISVNIENTETSACFHESDQQEMCILNSKGLCENVHNFVTSVDTNLFHSCFDVQVGVSENQAEISVSLCSRHYKQYKKFKLPIHCCICDKNALGLKTVNIPPEKQEIFQVYLYQEMQVEKEVDACSAILCYACYKPFNNFVNSEDSDIARAKTDFYLEDCLKNSDIPSCLSLGNIDIISFNSILESVVKKFLVFQPVLLPKLYASYKKLVFGHIDAFQLPLDDIEKLKLQHEHDARWLYKMLKSRLGQALQVFTPQKRNAGRMLYRFGSDLLQCLHTCVLNNQTENDKLKNNINTLQTKIDNILSETSLQKSRCLDDALLTLKHHVKTYINDSLKSKQLPDIQTFDVIAEIKKIDPVLWNFIFGLTANDEEEKMMKKNAFIWEKHFLYQPLSVRHENLRFFPRLYIASCIFNSQNSHCTQPLHLLMTDVVDKYSSSSTEMLTINARIGAGVSKESLKRFISNRCTQIQNDSNTVSESFTIASFDNLDKNQSYALVASGKEKSGFHGTTIQSVVPLPSEKCHPSELLSAESTSNMSLTSSFVKSNSRSVSYDLVKSLKEPVDKIGNPSDDRYNKFNDLQLHDFHETDLEKCEWIAFTKNLTSYGLVKQSTYEKGIILPGLKTYLAYKDKSTEKSKFQPIAVLDDPADSKETILKTLNILHEKYKIGDQLQYLVVVGDGKSYDHLIKLKSEYGGALNWVLAFPGDWHILKNILPIFIKIYYDAGLKELAIKYHKGATLKVLVDCTKFSIANRFFINIWEAIFRYQIETFLNSEASPDFKHDLESLVDSVLQKCDQQMTQEPDILHQEIWSQVLNSKFQFENLTQTVLEEFTAWRKRNNEISDTFKFWDTFVHVDFMSYLGLYLAIRSRNWELRNVSLKKLACLFYAFDRHNYLRMIPYHLADLLTFPKPVLEHFQAGGFAVSISGENYYSVAADEAHEMEINLKTKQAIHSFNPSSLTALTYYLPYRAETLHSFRSQLSLGKSEQQQHREMAMPHIKSEELTVREYIAMLKLSQLFTDKVQKTLCHIFSGVCASNDQSDSLMNYRQYGTTDMENYISCFLIKTHDITAKPPARKRRNLKTFSVPKVTVHTKKKEIKDNQIIIACLRKKIAFSKLTKEAITDLDQFIGLPKAICNSEGIPEKGQKSASLQYFRALYKDAFLNILPTDGLVRFTTVILEGMFMIQTTPLPMHKTFKDYAEFLFNRWIVRSHAQYRASEVHVVFDHPNRHGISPKDIERSRRDSSCSQNVEYKTVTSQSTMPGNWRNFLAIREQKRQLVNYLSDEFLHLAQMKFMEGECYFITSGGFDDDRKDLAFGSFGSFGIKEAPNFRCDHEEGDSRVWFNALQTTADRVIIYSPDTDTTFIGLPLVQHLHGKSVYVNSRDSSTLEKEFIDINSLVSLISNDIQLQGSQKVEECLLMVYILSGCDFVSFFKGCGKKKFFDCFRKNFGFITNELCHVGNDKGLLAFYRLVLTVYFLRYKTAFEASSVEDLYKKLPGNDDLEKHKSLIHSFREIMWDRATNEEDMLPNADALKLHWMRCCWVYKYWRQSFTSNMKLEQVQEYGWTLNNDVISVKWDTEENMKKVEDTVQWYTKGCSCKSGCKTNRCSCKRSKTEGKDGYCGPGCKCQNCVNIPNTCIEEQLDDTESNANFNNDEDDLNDSDLDEVCLDDDLEVEQSTPSTSTDDPLLSMYWNTFSDIF